LLLLLFASRRHHPRPGERLLLSVSILPPSSPAFVLSPDVLIVSRSTLIALFRAPLKAIPKLPSKCRQSSSDGISEGILQRMGRTYYTAQRSASARAQDAASDTARDEVLPGTWDQGPREVLLRASRMASSMASSRTNSMASSRAAPYVEY